MSERNIKHFDNVEVTDLNKLYDAQDEPELVWDEQAEKEKRRKKREAAAKRKKANKRKNIITIAIMVVAGCVFCFAAYKLITILGSYNEAKGTYEEIREIFNDPAPEKETIKTLSGEVVKAEVMKYDFQKLLDINPEAVGYLKSQGIHKNVVDFPVAQHSDNDYYLTHMFNGWENSSGAIFMDAYAYEGFDSKYCIIYGHNMRSGDGMFRCLSNFQDYDYFRQHVLMDVYAGQTHYVYQVFAAFQTDVSSFVYNNYANDSWEGARDVFVNGINMTKFDTGVTADDFPDDPHIITLSTCLENYSSTGRYVVMLVRIKELEE